MHERGSERMKCPFCESFDTKVVDSRPTEEGYAIRRRRECEKCRKRFTTYEKVEEVPLMVIKRDGTREPYNRNKVINGMIRACEKRPATMKDIENIADNIERILHNTMEKEVRTTYIGELVMDHLKELDEVAYVRFASVYRQFKDINTFMEELEKLLNEKK